MKIDNMLRLTFLGSQKCRLLDQSWGPCFNFWGTKSGQEQNQSDCQTMFADFLSAQKPHNLEEVERSIKSLFFGSKRAIRDIDPQTLGALPFPSPRLRLPAPPPAPSCDASRGRKEGEGMDEEINVRLQGGAGGGGGWRVGESGGKNRWVRKAEGGERG